MINTKLQTNLNLPNHTAKLREARKAVNNIKSKFKTIVQEKSITNNSHTILYEEIIRVLDYLGNLSQHIFNIEDQLENQYFTHFKHNPSLAKQLWLEHYDSLHLPYSQLKNICYKMLDQLDDEFIIVHKKYPRNWNY